MNKIAVVVSGWHFPLHFYKKMRKQKVPKGWQIDFFVVSHRDPSHAVPEVEAYLKTLSHPKDIRERIDRQLYKKVATREEIEKLGWTYIEKPNSIGDWGNLNQWLDDYDYKEYEVILSCHDDNYLFSDEVFTRIWADRCFPNWYVVSNSRTVSPDMYSSRPMPYVRGSFDFFKTELLTLLGGRFDLSEVKLTREGKTDSPETTEGLFDWNLTVAPLARFIEENGLRDTLYFLSPFYRVSPICIEGERGFISKSHGNNKNLEDAGIRAIIEQKLLNPKSIR